MQKVLNYFNFKEMNIAYITLKGNSGSDVYFEILKKSLDEYTNIRSELFFLPSWLERLPFLIPFYIQKLPLHDFDIIHTNVEFAHFFKVAGKKLVTTIHHVNFDEQYQKYTTLPQKVFHYLWIRPNMKISLQKANINIAVSNFTERSCRKFFPGKYHVQVIHNGIDTNLFKPIDVVRDNKKYRLLFIGNQSQRKGWDLVIEIMKKLGDKYELYYTGLRDNKSKELEKYGMFSLGKLSHEELVLEYNKADLFVFPTRLEGFGYSVVESLASGTPVISTNYSSIPEIIQDGVNGYLCKINDVDDFVERIKFHQKNNIFNKAELSKSVQKFNYNNLARGYAEVYAKL